MKNPFKRKTTDDEATEMGDAYDNNPEPSNDDLTSSNDNCPPIEQDSDGNGELISYEKFKLDEMGVGVVQQAMDVYKTSLLVEQNIATIRATSEIQLAQIASKFEFCKSALEHVFQDRHSALAAHYCALDNAMKSNDREMILCALRGISSIVVTSPLSDFKEIINNWDDFSKKKPLELDF